MKDARATSSASSSGPNLRLRNATDGLIALRAGYPTVTLGSVDEFKIPTNYHWPTDTRRPRGLRHGGRLRAAGRGALRQSQPARLK